jgi:hypothetical protein
MEELDVLMGSNPRSRLVQFFETQWKMVALFFLGLIAAVWAFSLFGIPVLAEKIAYAVPPKLASKIGRHTLEVLDDHFLQQTELDQTRKNKIKGIFTLIQKASGGTFEYTLLFRKNPPLGPNAFALSSGEIIITYELVKIAKTNREI